VKIRALRRGGLVISASRDYRSRGLRLRLGQSYCVLKVLGPDALFSKRLPTPGPGTVVQSAIRLTQD